MGAATVVCHTGDLNDRHSFTAALHQFGNLADCRPLGLLGIEHILDDLSLSGN